MLVYKSVMDNDNGGGSNYTAGDGIDITNDVISTKQSEEGDIDEIIDVYPQAGELVSIVNAFNRGDIYSTEERMIGQWIDGKPLYAKTFVLDTPVTISSGKWGNIVSIASLNIDELVEVSQARQSGNNYLFSIFWDNDATNLKAYAPSNNLSIQRFIIKYTKTTDTAISIGSENEYSTDEKVIGTWIDGKPVYQKVLTGFNIGSTTDAWTNTQSSGTLGIDIDTLVSVKILRTSDKSECRYMSMKYDTSSQQLQYYILKKYANCDTIIIQYTKST